MTLCHHPPGEPENISTITVGTAALSSHLAHGDYVGSCGGEPVGLSDQNLISIDPETGVGTVVMPLGVEIEGLALGPDGIFYGSDNNKLWRIDVDAQTVTQIGSHSFGEVEALEYAFGDYDPQVEVPGIPSSWTANGILFGFSDDDNAFLIFDPATGAALAYDCAFDTPDCEGIVFLTQMSDMMSLLTSAACD